MSSTSEAYKKSKHDCLNVLCCKILIWQTNDDKIQIDDPEESRCLIIRECESIEIEDTYKKLITTASVKFPRGTVVRRTITNNDENSTVYTERMSDGTIAELRKNYSIAKPEDFRVGQRIRIYLGYYKDNGRIFASNSERVCVMEEEAFVKNVPDFDGYIVKCSVSSPIEIKCENLASGLKRKNVVKIAPMKVTVNDLLKEGGKFDLLKGTGLKLHPKTAEMNIDIGIIKFPEGLTVADILSQWNKFHLYSFIRRGEDGTPYLMVGHTYLSGNVKSSIINLEGCSQTPEIHFDYHVSNNNLSLLHVDPGYLAVSAQGFKFEGNKTISYNITIRLNPEWNATMDPSKKFQLLNETKLNKKALKMGATLKSSVNEKVDLSNYNVVPYLSLIHI